VSRYDGPAHLVDIALALAVSPDGSTVFVTGTSDYDPTVATTIPDFATVAYDASTGASLWVSTYDGPAGGKDHAADLERSPDGSTVFVTGFSDGGPTSLDYATVAYVASTGETLWVSRYGSRANEPDYASAIGVSRDGSTVFVTGDTPGRERSDLEDFATVAYDASTGMRLWVGRFDGPTEASFDSPHDLEVSPDGSTVYVTGDSGYSFVSNTVAQYATVAYDASTGATKWVRRYDGPAKRPDRANEVALSPDGSTVFVTGRSHGGSTTLRDYATVAYDASTGATKWVRRYNGPTDGPDMADDVQVSPDGSTVFVTGGSTGSNFDYTTVAYDASTGTTLWVKRYKGPSDSFGFASALEVTPDGSTLLVTGSSNGDYVTVAYDATSGERLWVSRYDGHGEEDSPRDLGMSPDGSLVFVTGSSGSGMGSSTSVDYATVAYETG
jgi:outer membrane protein assembly factor BamB